MRASGDARHVAHRRRADALLDRVLQRLVPAEHEHRLGDDEHRADEQADEVVDERGLAPFVPVADELDHPAARKAPDSPAEPHRIDAGVRATAPAAASTGRASRTPTANTIIGTPTKWLMMLRRSRW